jgi:hypothetical protein
MPELVPKSTAAPAPPPIPPGMLPPDWPAVPPTIDPAAWEDFPIFRETFLLYVSEPSFNAALRTAAEHFFAMLLETYDRWPAWPESSTRTELRAAVADMRHLQGFLASVGQERRFSSLEMGDVRLSRHASGIARLLKRAADSIERQLAKGEQ